MVHKTVMDEWRDAFSLRLRLREVPGARIGEALAEVETHCADGGQSPQEAFGDPVAYADALADNLGSAAAAPKRTPRWAEGLRMLAAFVGINFLLQGVATIPNGSAGVLTAGHLLAIVFGAAAVTAIMALLIRSGRRRIHWPLATATVVSAFATVYAQVALTEPLMYVAGWLLTVVGVLLLVVAWYPLASGSLLTDRIVDPRTGREPYSVSRPVLVMFRWGLPVMVLCAVVLVLVLPPS